VLPGLSVDAPEGTVRLDEKLQNAWRTARVGEVVEGHKFPQFDVVFSSPGPLRPQPFPEGRTPEQWKQFLDVLYKKWGDRWERER
jgi:urea transport system substrate-binding protein